MCINCMVNVRPFFAFQKLVLLPNLYAGQRCQTIDFPLQVKAIWEKQVIQKSEY